MGERGTHPYLYHKGEEENMKRRFQRVIALACALLFGATIFAGIPGMTARAEEGYIITEAWQELISDQVVHEGEILSSARAVFYLKPGMSEACAGYIRNNVLTSESLSYYLHDDYNRDVYFYGYTDTVDHEVLAPEEGSSAYIVSRYMTLYESGNEKNVYLLEPLMDTVESETSNNTAPVYVYVEPAWLTAWKELLTDIDKQIADAKVGDIVILDLGEYYNISNARMQQIAEKNDVTFILNITYDKVSYSLTIEPGTEIDLSCDWYGPLKLLSMFPYEVVE